MDMKIHFPGGLRVTADWDPYSVQTDQPLDDGGTGTAPSPFELFLASLATCAGFYVLSFCRQRGIATEGISLSQSIERDPARKLVRKIKLQIELPPDFPEKYRDAVVKAADQCTVKKHFAHPPTIEIAASVATPITHK